MGLETGAIIGIAGAAASTAGAVASAASQPGAPSPIRLELPPELEEKQLDQFSNFLGELEQDINTSKELIPFLEERITTLDEITRQATPSGESIARLNDLDQQIAERFGVEVQKDVQAGIITDAAKEQALALQEQVAQELQSQGTVVDDQLLVDIQERIRNQVSGTSADEQALGQIRDALLKEVTEQGDVLRRDPAVERQIKEQEAAVLEDLSRRGIDPNSTAGRRALNDFRQQATETRFRVSESLKTQGVSRRVAAAQGVIGIQQAAQQATSTSISQAAGAQELRSNRIRRLAELAGVIQTPIDTAIAAQEPERLRRSENLQRAGVALDASQLLKQTFQGGLAAQADILKLQELPAQFRSRILEGRETAAGRFERLGAQDFTENTRRLLEEGSIDPFTRTTPQRRVAIPFAPGTPGGPPIAGIGNAPAPQTPNYRVGPNGELIPLGGPLAGNALLQRSLSIRS